MAHEQNKPILQGVANDLDALNDRIEAAQELVSLMKAANEDTSSIEAQLMQARQRRDTWLNALKERGIVPNTEQK